MRRLLAGLRALVGRRRLDRDLDDELRGYVDSLVEQHIRDGMPPEEALRAARTTIGSLEAIKDAVRDVGWESRLESVWQDVRHSFRGLRRSPGFAAVAILTLALGTGANTAIFTLIDALLLRSLPVPNPEQLVQLTMVVPTGAVWQSFSYPLVRGLADRREIFTSLAGFSGALFDVGPPTAMETTPGAWVTGRYYETLGVKAVAGRLLTADDDQPGVSPVVVISDGYWRRKFGRDPHVIGQRLIIGRSTATIVGVSESGFEGATVGEAADLTLPIGVLPQVAPERAEGLEASSTWLRVLARPRNGVSAIQTRALLATAWPVVATSAIPAGIPIALRRALASTVDVVPGATGWSPLRAQFRRPLLVLMAFVAVVLLIACVNVGNLLLARTASRRGEITVRLAIGGRRSRIIRQLLTESAVLAFLGAGLGLVFAQAGCRLLVSLLSSGRAEEIALNLIPNSQVLAFTSAVAIATSLLFGLAPAFGTSALTPAGALTMSGRRVVGAGRRLAPALMSAQIALCIVLLVGAGLLVMTLRNLRTFDAGFRREAVLLVDVDPRRAGYQDDRLFRINEELLEEIARLPGVRVASFSSITPVSGSAITRGVRISGREAGEETYANNVSPRFFEVLDTPIIRGRDFTDRDTVSSPRVAVVNEAFVRRHFRDRDPIGIQLSIGSDRRPWEIVGVAADVVYESMRDTSRPTVYTPYRQMPGGPVSFEAAIGGAQAPVTAALHEVVQSKLPGVRVAVRTLTSQVERSLITERLLATLAGAFGALALILAVIGVYGLLTYSVTLRTGEIGIRMALGARRARVLRLVLGEILAFTAAGMVIGLCAAAIGARALETMLFGLSPFDPATFVVVALIFIVATLLAAFPPARRATSVDPLSALRYE